MNSQKKKRKLVHPHTTYSMATVGDQFAALAFRQHKQQTELNEIKAQLGDISNQISKIVESLQRIELALNISDASQQAIPSEYNYFA